MKCATKFRPILVLIGAMTMLASSPVSIGQQLGWIAYSAKFVCGTRPTDVLAVTGEYRSVINIHNPHYLPDQGVTFFKKAVRALPQRAPFGEISPRKQELLPPDHAIGVDCGDILNLYPTPPTFPFIEGYVVIEIPPQVQGPSGQLVAPELDVSGVYTVRPRDGHEGTAPDAKSLHIERYDPVLMYGEPPIPQ